MLNPATQKVHHSPECDFFGMNEDVGTEFCDCVSRLCQPIVGKPFACVRDKNHGGACLHPVQARRSMRRHVYTIREGDVGGSFLHFNGRLRDNPLGTTLPEDVGKRVYEVDGILQVENQEQFKKRTEKC